MKFPDMNQYITLLFSLLAEFFLPHRTQPPGAGDRPSRSPACLRDEQDLHDYHELARLYGPETVVRECLIPNGSIARPPHLP